MDDLVLLHAFPLDARMWDVPGALTPSLRGHGEPDLDTVAEQVLGVLDERKLDSVVLGGCSMGGYITMALLRRAPERVRGLIFVDTKHTADAPEAAANRHAMADRVEREGVGDWLADAMLPNLLGPNASDTARASVRTMILEQRAEDVAWWQRAMAKRPDSTDVLESLDVPSLVLVGEHDKLTPPDVAAKLAVTLRHSTSERIEDAGHLPPVEQPEEFRARLERWREQVEI
ncbi:Pimeloyl-ACP methyl ester carboxylesterase [Lentzea waywayandensis]|uniref:Pimeloyl-ACP methyl ester carboxylesterase n=1 Tax=Lentzea waywayandensis TaxID=84724 RepID=A0A1I6E2W1_9PSEU|nr:alpha/beta fold hydrolase [Lentzea waywayandensis]SFR12053.1 Pimeloyl-ACP methyl ester carboxylesterase [Lentzea waywayandensis]